MMDNMATKTSTSLSPFGCEQGWRTPLFGLAAMLVLTFAPVSGLGEESPLGEQVKAESCFSAPAQALPNRLTVSNPADTTQCGVAEVEYGWERDWPGGGALDNSSGSLLRFGLARNLEFRWSIDQYLSTRDGAGLQHGIGDNWLGLKYRFHRQSGAVPALALNYAVKVPSASYSKGLGSGRVDHELSFLASQDGHGFHWDFNANVFADGRAQVPGFDHNVELAWALSHSLRGPLQIAGEISGDSRLNPATPGYAGALAALSYAVSPRLVLDCGLSVGLTSAAARKRLVFGLTYSLTNLYTAGMRRRIASKEPRDRTGNNL